MLQLWRHAAVLNIQVLCLTESVLCVLLHILCKAVRNSTAVVWQVYVRYQLFCTALARAEAESAAAGQRLVTAVELS
jgi:hypothetical protein